MKNKRGTDHNWQIVKYKGDIALYAKCKCGFHYCCSSAIRNIDGSWSIKQKITKIYPYCPYCGARKKTYNNEINKINKFPWE